MCRNGTGHKCGFVFRSLCLNRYLLMHFHTDFFLEVNGQTLYGKAGDWVLHQPGNQVAHGPRGHRAAFVDDWLFFTAEEEDKPLLAQLPYDTPVPVQNDGIFEHCVSEILREHLHKDPFSAQQISGHIYHLLSVLHRAAQAGSLRADALHLQFRELRTHILEHCARRWTLKEMSTRSGYSVSRFCELYKQFFGKSPIDDLLDERLDLAKHLLSLNAYSVSEVAARCGFSSVHYFSGFFKSRTGFAPTDY